MRIDGLVSEVRTRYDRMGLPSWADPHPGGAGPASEEYSRVTDPARYRIVHARADAWAQTLGADDGVAVEITAAAPGSSTGTSRVLRQVRLSSSRPGTLPLLLVHRAVDAAESEEPLPLLDVAVVRSSVVCAMVPDCGCDACDSGSDDLLDSVDDAVSQVVGGPSVLIRGAGWQAHWHPDGGSSGGETPYPDHDELMELCRRIADGRAVTLPSNAEAFAGRAWFA